MQLFTKTTMSAWGWRTYSHGGVVLLAGLIAVGATSSAAHGADPNSLQPDDVAIFMRSKLDHASEVLEGLSLADFEKIRRGGQLLALASQSSSWQVLQSEEYARRSLAFRRACERLEVAAADKNLDAAALAWMDVTMRCIQCHRYVRDDTD